MGSLTLKDLKESTEPYWTVSLGVQRNGTGQKPKGGKRPSGETPEPKRTSEPTCYFCEAPVDGSLEKKVDEPSLPNSTAPVCGACFATR